MVALKQLCELNFDGVLVSETLVFFVVSPLQLRPSLLVCFSLLLSNSLSSSLSTNRRTSPTS